MSRLSKIGAAALGAFGWTGGGAAIVSASYLQVAGGGAGGTSRGGGGGAGGYLTGTTSLNSTLSYTVIVGAGGAAANYYTIVSGNGGNSQFGTLTASVGGGGGASDGATAANGGSGGGGGTGGTATSGQGNNGGNGTGSAPAYAAGGGGGAGAVGGNFSSQTAGSGGVGVASTISGTSTFYAGGGGGGTNGAGTAGSGGNGGGGAGSAVSGGAGTPGTANTGGGGGGGGGWASPYNLGGNGGSGVVIISYLGAQQFGGGVVTSVGGNTIHTFNTSGTLSPLTSLSASYLIVAGGGGAGIYGGGGGAGGLLTSSGLTIDANSTYLVTVGAGGVGTGTQGITGVSGGNSTFYSVTSIGGGGGGVYGSGSTGSVGLTGGSGGGGGSPDTGGTVTGAGGSGTSGQGFAGGSGITDNSSYRTGGGGGGASAVGTNGTSTNGGNGGNGIASSISGTSVTYAGGGGGGTNSVAKPAGTGGTGGGGAGGAGGTAVGTNGTTNLGGGGGGASGATGGNGGSGIVIISYAGSTQLMAGGTVTIVGGNVIHTFLSSGYLSPLTYVGNSLRLRNSASGYLSRTPTVASNRQIFTWSGWVKRGGNLGVFGGYVFGATNDGFTNNWTLFYFTGDTLNFQQYASGSQTAWVQTTQVFRDPAAWYHLTLSVDTTQATAANRVKIYVNGSLVTALSQTSYPAQNNSTYINFTYAHSMGSPNIPNFDGYMSNVQFIDGQQLTPNAFGTFNQYGVWQPIYYGGSYGTNGFYLKFNNTTSTTTLGYDTSPAGNNWTPTNISLTAGSTYDSMTDVPTLTSTTAANYCTLNPLFQSAGTYSNGNLKYVGTGSTTNSRTTGTIGVNSDKYYWEVTVTAAPYSPRSTSTWYNAFGFGLASTTSDGNGPNVTTNTINYQDSGYYKNFSNANTDTGSAVSNGDVLAVAVDLGANTFTFYKNNTSVASGTIGTTAGTMLVPVFFSYDGLYGQMIANFGQQPFTYTPPSGFVALNTYNL